MENQNADTRSQKYSVMLVATAIIVLLAVVCCFLVYQSQAVQKSRTDTYEKLTNQAQEQAEAINNSLNDQFLILETFAQSVTAREWQGSADMIMTMKSVADATAFVRMWNINSDGMGFSSDGGWADFSKRDYFKVALSGKNALNLIDSSVVDGEPYYVLAVPVRDASGSVIGVVSGTISMETFCSMMKMENANAGGYSFICYANGHIISVSGSTEQFLEGVNIVTTVKEANGKEAGEALAASLEAQETGSLTYAMGGADRYAVYCPLGRSGWMLFNAVPGEYVTNSVTEATRSGLYTMLIVLALCVLLIAVIFYCNRQQNHGLRKEFKRIHMSEERFRIAINSTEVSIWEYDIKGHRIIQTENSMKRHGLDRIVENVPESLIENGYIHPDSIEVFREMYRKLVAGEKCVSCVVRAKKQDGFGYWYEHIRYTNFLDRSGRPYRAIGVSEDVTEKFEAKANYERELRLQQVLAPDVYATALFDVTDRAIVKTQFWSATERELFSGASFDNYFSISSERVREDAGVKSFLQGISDKSLIGSFQKKQDSFAFDFLRIMADGDERWVHEDMHLLKDPDSGHLMMFLCIKDVDTEKKRIDKLSLAAETDSMTGLLNHQVTLEQIGRYLESEGAGGSHALFMTDVDFFKEVNDSVGHQAGDEVIIRVSSGISRLFRADDIIGRMGGDEFLVFMKNVPNEEAAAAKAAELVGSLQFSCSGGGNSINITSSIGAVFFTDDGSRSVEQLYRAVDNALYKAKEGGRSQFCLSDVSGAVISGKNIEGDHAPETASTVQLQAIMENIDGSVYLMEIGEKFKTLYISPSFYKTAGEAESKAVARGADIMSFIHPDDRERFEAECRKYAESGEPWDHTYRVVLAGGAIGWRHGRAVRIPYEGSDYPVMIDVVTDVTEMMKTTSRLDAILNNSPAGICQFNLGREPGQKSEITFANDEFVRMCGLTRKHFEENIAPDATRLLTDDEKTVIISQLAAARDSDESVEYIHRYTRPDDDGERYFSVRALHLESSADGVESFLAILLDVTDQIKLERALAESRRPAYISGMRETVKPVSYKQAVLVVDDSSVNRKILTKIIQDEYVVLEAENGFDALSTLRRHIGEIHAVLLDLVMPLMDGYAFLEEKNSDESLKDVPVIVVTGNSDSETETRVLREGAWDFLVKPLNPDVVKFRLENVITRSQMTAFSRLQYLADFDELTGIFNKQKLFAATKEMLLLNRDREFAFIRFDINHFGLVNTFYGSDEGDRVLKYLARCMNKASCEVEMGTYGRIESDVFGVCIPFESAEQLEGFFDATKYALDAYGLDLDLIPAFGVYIVEDHDMAVDQIYDNACLAAKKCKGSYTRNYCYYDLAMGREVLQEQEIANTMNNALEAEQFEVFLQPKVSLATGATEGAEALVRWRDPEKGVISPGEFIPVFERNGFICKLDFYVWRQTCILLRRWLDEGRDVKPVSVNISRVNLYGMHLLETICSLTDKYRVPRRLLNLELTESAYVSNPDIMLKVISQLRERGYTVMMDDFGSGFSSLNSLKDIAVDVLKIDLRFLSGASNNERGGHIIRSVVEMAHGLNMTVVAEGVETEEQAQFLQSIGCDYAQGFLYAQPMPVSDFEAREYKD